MSKTHKDRVLKLASYEKKVNNVSYTAFSKKVGVSLSTINSLSKSKDGYVKSNLIEGIYRSYPNVNMDWLLLGEGEMYYNTRDSTDIGHSNQKDMEITHLKKEIELLQQRIKDQEQIIKLLQSQST